MLFCIFFCLTIYLRVIFFNISLHRGLLRPFIQSVVIVLIYHIYINGHLVSFSPFYLVAAQYSDAGVSFPWWTWKLFAGSQCCSDSLSFSHLPEYLGGLFVFPYMDILCDLVSPTFPLEHIQQCWHEQFAHLCILVGIWL